jgi:Tol biopolymer transport system component
MHPTSRAVLILVILLLLAGCEGRSRASRSPTPAELPGVVEDRQASIAFSGDDGEIHVLSLARGDERAVTSAAGPQFDPDGHGRLLVFRDSRAGVNVNDDIAVIRMDGTAYRNLTRTPDADEWGPVWSPDGRRIAYSSDEGGVPMIFVMDADGSNARRLSDVWGEYPAWSPDGSRIAFASSIGGSTPFGEPDYDVFVMDADGSSETNLTNDADSADMYPTWSPDGGWIAFESTRGTPPSFEPPERDLERRSDYDLWVIRPDGSDARNLTSDLDRQDRFPDWSTHGLLIDREGTIVVLDPRSGAEEDVSERTGVVGTFAAWIDR